MTIGLDSVAQPTTAPQEVHKARRLYRRGEPDKPVELSAASSEMLSRFEDVLADKRSRVSLTWPIGPEDVAIFHSLAALDRISDTQSGGLSTLFFPWSVGSSGFQRSTFVDRGHILAAVKPTLEAVLGTHDRRTQSFVFGLHSLQHVGRSGKNPKKVAKALAKDASTMDPSVFEIMPQAGVSAKGRIHGYDNAFLGRVRRHTWFSDSKRVNDLATAAGSPFFLLGLHHQAISAKGLKHQGLDPRTGGRTPDVILLDLTRRARRRLSPKWRDATRKFLDLILTIYGNASPPLYSITDDAFVAQELRWKLILDYDQRRLAKSENDRSPVRTSIVFNRDQDFFGIRAFTAGNFDDLKVEAYGSDLLRVQEFAYSLCQKLEDTAMPPDMVDSVRNAGFVLQNLMSVPGSPRQIAEFINDNLVGLDRDRVGASFDWQRARGSVRAAVDSGLAGRHQAEMKSCCFPFNSAILTSTISVC